jgi:protein-disulfide isomerase
MRLEDKMAKKRETARTRRKQKKQVNKNQNLIIAGAAMVFIVGLILFGMRNQAGVYDERFDLDPVLGNPDAPVTIIEYGAYGCSACKGVHQSGVLDQILEEYAGQVNLIFRDMPVISPHYDFMSAQLAQCTFDQSNDLFWKFHDMMYSTARQSASSRGELVTNAGRLGVDTDALNECYDVGTHADTVRYDQRRGSDAGVRGTPTFFINGERLFSFSPDGFRQAINQALG